MTKYQKNIDKLSPLARHVTQQCGTEPAFDNEFWDYKKEGIYVDIVSDEPLFCSVDKFDSGTGWPSFYRCLNDNVVEKTDNSYGMKRIEACSKQANSHLGHVFSDVPDDLGVRYCINSAALRFVAKEDLEEQGYGEFLKMFKI